MFTVLIWGSDRAKFGKPEVDWKGKRICATGKIAEHNSVPEIVAKEKSQIEVEK